MTNHDLKLQKDFVENLWQNSNQQINQNIKGQIDQVIDLINLGEIRVAEKNNDTWSVNEWVKKAILLYFKINKSELIEDNKFKWFDKVPNKFTNWSEQDFINNNFRVVPGAFVRNGCYIGPKSVIMPSFINIGAHIGEGTMVDTWSTIGSCAQIGKYCHISGGVGIGGVLEPLQANPVIIEDNCFIGARSEIAEGVIVREGSVISMGVFLGSSTKIYDRETKQISYGEIPPYSVVIPGVLKSELYPECSLNAAIIVKKVDEKTRSKVSINELLRS